MKITKTARGALKRIVFGPVDFPQQCPIPMRDPQEEVTVWLHGLGAPLDVTHRHIMACGTPFTIGIGFDGQQSTAVEKNARVSLSFHERNNERRLLGAIGLNLSALLRIHNQQLYLFHARSYRNYCLPRTRLWARHLQYALQRRSDKASEIRLTAREAHSMFVFYICPRPVGLVSVADGTVGNIFPMNLMGPIGNGYFSFALNSARPATALVERAGMIALSSIPFEQTSQAYELGKNHKKECVDWGQLPFSTKTSATLGLPVPEFSLSVREMKIETSRRVGSHTLFVARTIHEERYADDLQFFVVHGIYQAWRERGKREPTGLPFAARQF